jgi:hypothetical protein
MKTDVQIAAVIPCRARGQLDIILSTGDVVNLTDDSAMELLAKLVNAIAAMRKADGQ